MASLMFVDYLSNDALKDAFQELHVSLVRDLDAADVADHLFAVKVLNLSDLDDVNSITSRRERVKHLLIFLHKSKHSRAFIELRLALMSHENKDKYEELVNELGKKYRVIIRSRQQATAADRLTNKGQLHDSTLHAVSSMNIRHDNKGNQQQQDNLLSEAPPSTAGKQSVQNQSGNAPVMRVDTINEFNEVFLRVRKRLLENSHSCKRASAAPRRTSEEPLQDSPLAGCSVHTQNDNKGNNQQQEIQPSAASSLSPAKQSSLNLNLIHSFNGDKPAWGVTTLDNELYVWYQGQTDIFVYDKELFRLLRSVSVKGLEGAIDMASCKKYQCIYILDDNNKVMYRVEKADNKQTNWSVGIDLPSSVSVNSEYNVIVAFDEVRKIEVFSTLGVRLNGILQSDLEHPWHTIQLSTDRYVVCHGLNGILHRVVLTDGNGHIQHTFGNDRGSDDDQLDVPCRLAVLRNGFILVADSGNERLVVLSRTLRYVKRWTVSGRPCGMWFDKETDRIYVGVNRWNNEFQKWTSGYVEVYSISV